VTGSDHPLNRGLRATIRVMYLGYHGLPVMDQNSGYDQFPPAANGQGTIHPVPENGPTTPG
jgi:hypothetical protein